MRTVGTLTEKLWHPSLFGIFALITAMGFWFYNMINTKTPLFNGISIESTGFVVFGLTGLSLIILHIWAHGDDNEKDR